MLERPEPDEQLLQTDVAPSDSASSSLCSNAHPPTDMPSSVDQTATKHHQQRPTTCEGLASVVVDIAQSKISSPSQSNLLVIQRRNMENSAAHFRLIGIRNIRGLNTAYNMMQPFAFVADGLRRALNARVVQVRHL